MQCHTKLWCYFWLKWCHAGTIGIKLVTHQVHYTKTAWSSYILTYLCVVYESTSAKINWKIVLFTLGLINTIYINEWNVGFWGLKSVVNNGLVVLLALTLRLNYDLLYLNWSVPWQSLFYLHSYSLKMFLLQSDTNRISV